MWTEQRRGREAKITTTTNRRRRIKRHLNAERPLHLYLAWARYALQALGWRP